MKCYFHCDANMYRKRVRTFLEYTAVPIVLISVFLTLCLLLSLRNLMQSQLLLPAARIILAVIFVFALIVRIMLEVAEHKVRVHSKYTYAEIGLKDVIISLYAGSYVHRGGQTVLRRLIVIPLDKLEAANVTKKEQILITAKPSAIRDYIGNTDRLGYYFKDGNLKFKEFYFEECGFKSEEQFLVPRLFENAEEIVSSVFAAKERMGHLPPSKPYVFEEMSFVKARKARDKSKKMKDYW
ncbi:MAG: hypothetical protein FWH07_00715 [Oscillospiraceae bacterium]|nr:hypothetical protein [Oscillospiraceae bacterium]